jgi:hypothetical protein
VVFIGTYCEGAVWGCVSQRRATEDHRRLVVRVLLARKTIQRSSGEEKD